MAEFLKLFGKKYPKLASGSWKFESRPGGWIIASNPEGLRIRFALNEDQSKLGFNLRGQLWQGEVIKESAARGGSSQTGAGDSDLTAQFPGKVRKILVMLGQRVSEGEPLVLIEAMKMEFAIKAPYAGSVKKIYVEDGKQLSPGDRFLDIEAAEQAPRG